VNDDLSVVEGEGKSMRSQSIMLIIAVAYILLDLLRFKAATIQKFQHLVKIQDMKVALSGTVLQG
jgi:hypothetical protein